MTQINPNLKSQKQYSIYGQHAKLIKNRVVCHKIGLLTKRHSISTENWKIIIEHFDKIPKRTSSKSKENKQEKVAFKYFDEDYMPTDMVSNIFQYLDTLSQCQVNTGLVNFALYPL